MFSSIFHGNRDRIEYFVLICTLFILNDRFLPSLTMNQTANRFVDESKKMSASTVNNFCMDNNYLLYFFSNCLRGYGTPPCCYVLFVEIENKIRCNFINSFFSKLLMNSIAQWVRGFTANL